MQRGDNNEEFNFGAAFQCHFSHHHKQNKMKAMSQKESTKAMTMSEMLLQNERKNEQSTEKKTYFAITAPNAVFELTARCCRSSA
jgi:hypothetical protein